MKSPWTCLYESISQQLCQHDYCHIFKKVLYPKGQYFTLINLFTNVILNINQLYLVQYRKPTEIFKKAMVISYNPNFVLIFP